MLNLALFIGQLQLDSQRKVIEGIMQCAKRDGNDLFVYSITLSLDDEYNKGEYFIALNEDISQFDGFIIYTESIYSEDIRRSLIQKIRATGKPGVSIDNEVEGMINVSSNNDGAMREIIRHMIDVHQVKTVNYVGGPDNSIDAVERKRVVREEMQNSGLPIDEGRFFVGDYYARSGRAAVEYFEGQGLIRADAYVCANDQMALGVFYALRDRNIRVPQDVLLSGYDDIFQASSHYPRITSVTRHEEKVGAEAYESLVNKILGKPYEEKIEVNSDAVFAESCGCCTGYSESYRDVIIKYSGKNLQETRFAEMVSDFTADVTSVRDYKEIDNKLMKYVPGLGGDGYLAALFEKPDEYARIQDALYYSDGQFYFRDRFDNEGASKLRKPSKGGNMYVINSIHFGGTCYGYTMIRNSVMPLQSEFYRIFAITLGSVIEHINSYAKMTEMIDTLDKMWVYDPMTHVYNRAGFFKFANDMLLSAKYDREDLFMIFLDLDGLKIVNDVFGHETGDKLICEMADILRKCSDKDELLMRYGGDEFVVLGRGYDEDRMNAYVNRIRKAMDEINSRTGRHYRIDASIGFSKIDYNDNRHLSSLIDMADQKMYQEKRIKHEAERNKKQ